jgi:hypothetical protein
MSIIATKSYYQPGRLLTKVGSEAAAVCGEESYPKQLTAKFRVLREMH